MNRFGSLAVVALVFGFGCGSVQDETKKAPATKECTDDPGKVLVVLMNDGGKAICSGNAELDLSTGQKGSKAVEKLGEVEGADACGYEFTTGGSATLTAPGFSESKVSWDGQAKCTTKVIKVTMRP